MMKLSSATLVLAISFSSGSIATAAGNDSAMPADSPAGSMSERLGRYVDNGPGAEEGTAAGAAPGMSGGRRRMKERFDQMPEEKRKQILQKMRERRNAGGESGFAGGGVGGGEMPPGMDERGGPGTGPGPGTGGGFGGKRPMMDRPARNMRGRGGQMGGGGPGRAFFGRRPLDLTTLNLSEEQKTKIQSMRSENSVKARQVQKLVKEKRQEMVSMLFEPAATNAQIKKKHEELRVLQGQHEDLMIGDFLGIRSVLTKEQLQQLPQLKQDMAGARPGRGRPALGSAPPGPPPEDSLE